MIRSARFTIGVWMGLVVVMGVGFASLRTANLRQIDSPNLNISDSSLNHPGTTDTTGHSG